MSSTLKRGLIFASGLVMKNTLNWGVDYVLYPIALVALGVVWGGLIMTIFTVITNLILIKSYDWSKTDWLLIESAKAFRDGEPTAGKTSFITKVLRLSDPIVLFILSIWDDPFTTTLYMRRGGHQYNGMSRRDWMIFSVSSIISNLFWIGAWSSLIALYYWFRS